MSDAYDYYELELVTVPATKPGEFRIATAAVRDCGLCGRIISGMGGGGPSICTPCGDALRRGSLRGAVKWEEDGQS